tara:strand:+ start:767 stop:1135 length:369 start_codon:yes stop_codon:yes gene_type:complete
MFYWFNKIIDMVKNFFNLSQPTEVKEELNIIVDTKVDIDSFKLKVEDLLKPLTFINPPIDKLLEESLNKTSQARKMDFANKGCIVHYYEQFNNKPFCDAYKDTEEKRQEFADSMKPYAKPYI